MDLRDPKELGQVFFHGPREDSHNLKYWMASFTAENYNPGEEHKD